MHLRNTVRLIAKSVKHVQIRYLHENSLRSARPTDFFAQDANVLPHPWDLMSLNSFKNPLQYYLTVFVCDCSSVFEVICFSRSFIQGRISRETMAKFYVFKLVLSNTEWIELHLSDRVLSWSSQYGFLRLYPRFSLSAMFTATYPRDACNEKDAPFQCVM